MFPLFPSHSLLKDFLNNRPQFSEPVFTYQNVVKELDDMKQHTVDVDLDKGTRIHLPVPGATKENVTVKVRNNAVVIRVKIEEDLEDKNIHNVRSQTIHETIQHSFNKEDIEASVENGLLGIFVPVNGEDESDEYTVEL